MYKYDLSIIIVSYNTRDLTLRCINSLKDDRFTFKKEVIVVDNGSTDGSYEELKKLGKGIKLIRNKANLGYAKANNQGIELASGNYILLLNSDTVVKKKACEEMVRFAKKTPDAGVIGCSLINSDGSIQASCYRFPTLLLALKQYWLGESGLLDKFAPKGNNPVEVDIVVGAAFLITPAAIKRVGFLDERYFMFYEDFDYCRRLKRAGLKVYYLPSAGVVHSHGASGKNIAEEKNQWRRLIPSSKIYHGKVEYYLFNYIIWVGQKFNKFTGKL
jgi:GT2 family glycosyltransferase